MKRANSEKLDLVRKEILYAAMDLFQKYGIDKTTMEDIAEASGKGKSTLYYYFKTKEDVFSTAATLEHDKMRELLETKLREGKSAEEKIRLFFTLQEKALRTKVKLYPIIFKESKKHIELFHSLQRMNNTWEAQLFKSILHEGIASGELKSIKKEDCDTIAIAVVYSMHATQLTLLLEGNMPAAEDRTEMMLDILVRGLK